MIRPVYFESTALPGDLDSLSKQRVIFAALNLFVLAALLCLHISFASYWGKPSFALTALLAGSAALRAIELWMVRGRALGAGVSGLLTCGSIALNLALAVVLATVIDREDSQYFAVLAVPILESAFRFRLAPTIAVTVAADAVAFYWVRRYYRSHPPVDVGEYFEAGTISLIFLIVATLVSVMVTRLRRKHAQLAANFLELQRARERLLQEEKLGAIGRLSSALAHEIRNPVAMISSSLATSRTMTGADREEMLEIAGQEATRLVSLTNDLLSYAKPRKPAVLRADVREAVWYVADACRAHAQEKGIDIQVNAPEEVTADYDAGLLEQALMNLVLNAVDASPAGGWVALSVNGAGSSEARIEVENRGGPIPDEVAARLFEPFFTTKSAGTGLGLATAHNAVASQGGTLILAGNTDIVRFSLALPGHPATARAAAVT